MIVEIAHKNRVIDPVAAPKAQRLKLVMKFALIIEVYYETGEVPTPEYSDEVSSSEHKAA